MLLLATSPALRELLSGARMHPFWSSYDIINFVMQCCEHKW